MLVQSPIVRDLTIFSLQNCALMQVTAITKMYTLYGNGLSASLTISSSWCSQAVHDPPVHKTHADLTSADNSLLASLFLSTPLSYRTHFL